MGEILKTYKQSMGAWMDQLGIAEATLLQLRGQGIRNRKLSLEAVQQIRSVRRQIEAVLDGPQTTRTRRIKAEVAMTGLEQELDL